MGKMPAKFSDAHIFSLIADQKLRVTHRRAKNLFSPRRRIFLPTQCADDLRKDPRVAFSALPYGDAVAAGLCGASGARPRRSGCPPFPITGIFTAAFTAAMVSESIGGR